MKLKKTRKYLEHVKQFILIFRVCCRVEILKKTLWTIVYILPRSPAEDCGVYEIPYITNVNLTQN
jgi:hypothetical protein